jgi:hypothetical protein
MLYLPEQGRTDRPSRWNPNDILSVSKERIPVRPNGYNNMHCRRANDSLLKTYISESYTSISISYMTMFEQ